MSRCLLMLLALSLRTCAAAIPDTTQNNSLFTIHAAPTHRALADSIIRWAEECRERTEKRLGLKFRPVAIYLEAPPDAPGFRRMKGFRDRAYFDPVWLSQQGARVRDFVVHELVHCATEQHVQGRPGALPKWFSEGIADWVVGTPPKPPNGSLAQGAAKFSLADLSREWGHPSDLRYVWGHPLAYSLVECLVARHGESVLAQLLTAVKTCSRFEVAFQRVTGSTLEAFERDWRTSLKTPSR